MEKKIENIQLILDKIEANPECWDQTKWHCGTTHCFAGHAQIELIGKEDFGTVRRDARIFFGFSKREADYYFHTKRTLEELKTAIEPFFDKDGYDREGFDKDGYDRNGYDKFGYDRNNNYKDSYDRNGYARNFLSATYGYDKFGYDKFGYDRYGYDKDGFDIDNLDRNNKPKQ